MRFLLLAFALAATLAIGPLQAQNPPPTNPPSGAPASAAPAAAPPAAPSPKPGKEDPAKRDRDAEDSLRGAIEQSGNDRAALIRNLEEYLRNYPDAPRKLQVYRGLVEASSQLRDYSRALSYAEKIVALQPTDSAMMLFAVDLLERQGDDHSLVKAVGYISRVLDRVEKVSPGDRPPRISEEEWTLDHTKLLMSVYLIRGRLEMEQKNYDESERDLAGSYRLIPNPAAALRLGEIAESRKDFPQAIQHYLDAFVLPDSAGVAVDRRELRNRLGALWKQTHGTEAGLGEALLAAYDTMAAQKPTAALDRNHDAKEPSAFVLRQLDGSPLPLSKFQGKVLVLDFWATWCGPCRELEPLLAQVAKKYSRSAEVAFLAVNDDEDESRVPPYVAREKLLAPVAFADGLDGFLGVKSLPTIIVLDRDGKIVYRTDGFDPDTFIDSLTAALERVLHGAS